ncbi:MAG: hypothetical protein K8I29_12445 [Alphaproteobacteria bacterium]|uniref:Uncharacterized protein n=1 Tax=Candidatus Nitrobium versatile TaxID=2884831 RepID=A0A953M1P5_9BACT|nr:hypothetical protein [Candidatus Nitrobium versatile]
MKKVALLIRKYFIDTGFLVLCIAVALLLAERPKEDYRTERKAVHPVQQAGQKAVTASAGLQQGNREPESPQKGQFPVQSAYKRLEARNIFDPEGHYEKPKELKALPENPYNLIAVFQGRETRAVLREYTGAMVSLKVGDKMVDGFVVSGIDRLQVTAKKGKERKVYRIFDVKQLEQKKQ